VPRRTLIARVVVALAAVAVCLAVTARQGRQGPPDLSGLTEDGLAWRLEALGYRVHIEPADRALPSGRVAWVGLYAARPDVPESWDEIVSRSHATPARWHGVVLAKRRGTAWEPDPGTLAVGGFVLDGDPEELDRVAAALNLPR
jgi:hypothetical protein